MAEPDLTFEKPFKIAKAMEAAEKEAKDLQDTPGTAVNQLGRWASSRQTTRRYFNHPPNQGKSEPVTPDCYRCEQSTKLQTVNFRMLSAASAKRRVV